VAAESAGSEEREHAVVQRLRRLVVAVVVCGGLAAALGYVDGLVVTNSLYDRYVVPSGGDALTMYLLALLLPGSVAMRQPRWPQLLLWILWAFPCTLLALLVEIEPFRRAVHIELLWPACVVYALVAVSWLVLLVVIPVVRMTHRSPPLRLRRRVHLPPARIWRP